ncbi:MAG: excalibur calcium-binding domain-containing protein, partial [Desulfobulbus sp.]
GLLAIPPWEWKEDRGHAFAQDTLEKNLPHGGVVANKDVKRSTGNDFICDGRIYCSQMTSCEEAKFYLNHCPGTKMDGNNDGIPCEKQWCGH